MHAKTAAMLAFDPLQCAEVITGVSYKHDEDTAMLGMLLAMAAGDIKDEHLVAEGDTTMSNEIDRYIEIITDLGFEQVLGIPFEGSPWNEGDEPRKERFYVFAHRTKGILLEFDSYDTTRVNGGRFYYCWMPNPGNNSYGVTSSGSYTRLPGTTDDSDLSFCWAGYHDCREAIRHNIRMLDENGTFLSVWPKGNTMFLWLLHYMDTKDKDYDYKAINTARIAMLPDWVQAMINRGGE